MVDEQRFRGIRSRFVPYLRRGHGCEMAGGRGTAWNGEQKAQHRRQDHGISPPEEATEKNPYIQFH